MRHLYGVALAVVLAAAVFFAASWGYLRLLRPPGGVLPAGGGSLIHNHAVLEGFGALMAVGLLAGVLMTIAWFSPLASGLPGVGLLGWSGFFLFNVKDAVRFIPLKNDAYGVGFEGMLYNGVLAAAGLAMVVPLFIPSRWRGRVRSDAQDELGPPGGFTDPYGGFTSPAPETRLDNGLLTDWSETRPQPQIDPGAPPPTRSQAPWGPADYRSP